jgi:hypothetical protein
MRRDSKRLPILLRKMGDSRLFESFLPNHTAALARAQGARRLAASQVANRVALSSRGANGDRGIAVDRGPSLPLGREHSALISMSAPCSHFSQLACAARARALDRSGARIPEHAFATSRSSDREQPAGRGAPRGSGKSPFRRGVERFIWIRHEAPGPSMMNAGGVR